MPVEYKQIDLSGLTNGYSSPNLEPIAEVMTMLHEFLNSDDHGLVIEFTKGVKDE